MRDAMTGQPRRVGRTALTAAALLTLGLGGGCARRSAAPTPPAPLAPPSPQSEQTKVQGIQNNSGIPAAEKAAIMHSQAAAPPAH